MTEGSGSKPPEKNKGGRPRIYEKTDHHTAFLVSRETGEWIQFMADQRLMSVSVFVRGLIHDWVESCRSTSDTGRE